MAGVSRSTSSRVMDLASIIPRAAGVANILSMFARDSSSTARSAGFMSEEAKSKVALSHVPLLV